MMNRFKKTKYPNLKLVVYNKGLSKLHVVTLQKMCNCDVRHFPFETYPVHTRHSRCFAWKPIIIQTVLHEHDFIMCLDTSIRLRNVDPYFQKAKRYEIQVIQGLGSISVRTHSRLFDTLLENQCLFQLPRGQGRFHVDNPLVFDLDIHHATLGVMRTPVWIYGLSRREE